VMVAVRWTFDLVDTDTQTPARNARHPTE
jgi:hypothetical protein